MKTQQTLWEFEIYKDEDGIPDEIYLFENGIKSEYPIAQIFNEHFNGLENAKLIINAVNDYKQNQHDIFHLKDELNKQISIRLQLIEALEDVLNNLIGARNCNSCNRLWAQSNIELIKEVLKEIGVN